MNDPIKDARDRLMTTDTSDTGMMLVAVGEAVLALAEEQRTANLIAFIRYQDFPDLTHEQIAARLGVTDR